MDNTNLMYVGSYIKPCDDFPNNPARKVGITNNNKQRMKSISNGTEAYAPVEAIQLWQLPPEIPSKITEKFAHNVMDIFGVRTNREWFNGGNGDDNKVESFIELYMNHLSTLGFNIKALHENIDVDDENNEIISDEMEKIKVRGIKKKLPKIVTLNGKQIIITCFSDILRSIFRELVDSNKINSNICPIVRKINNKNCIVNNKSEHSEDKEFRAPYKYKDLFIELDGNWKTILSNGYYLIETFGNNEIILNIID